MDEPDGGDATGERHLLANCPQRLVWVEREGSALGERQAHAYACRTATHVSRKRGLFPNRSYLRIVASLPPSTPILSCFRGNTQKG